MVRKNGRPSPATSRKIREGVLLMRAEGNSVSAIASRLRIGERSVSRIVAEARKRQPAAADSDWRGRLAEKSIRKIEALLDSSEPSHLAAGARVAVKVLEGTGALDGGGSTVQVQAVGFSINPLFRGLTKEDLRSGALRIAKQLGVTLDENLKIVDPVVIASSGGNENGNDSGGGQPVQ